MNRKERRKLERQKLFTDDAKVEEAKPKSRQKQKKLFGRSSKTLDETGVYVECGPLGNFNSRCTFDKVSVVPLWKIGDEEILGKQQLSLLSKKSGCSLPNEPS